MNAQQVDYSLNTDQREYKKPTRYSDRQPAWIRRICLETPGLEKLAKPVKSWQPPKDVHLKYSKISPEHKQAARRRKQRNNQNNQKRER